MAEVVPSGIAEHRVRSRASRFARRLLLAFLTCRSAAAAAQAAAPVPAMADTTGSWDVMFDGTAFVQYDEQGGPRGGHQAGSLNWGMLMASRALGSGRIQLRAMASLDAIGVGTAGYPLLLQSGEEHRGRTIHDRQHPHDAIMELGVRYSLSVSKILGVSLYAAPVGEPALGPPTYMERPSASDNPLAPIGHHWQDATHVSFGVVTLGVSASRWKAELSSFNGREPDDDRWNVDPIRLDSWSGRLSFAAGDDWSAAASYGFLASPDQAAPAVPEHRATASVAYASPAGSANHLSSTLIWGGNLHGGDPSISSSFLVEAELQVGRLDTWLGRVETVQKRADELALSGAPAFMDASRRFTVSECTLGFVRELATWHAALLGLGAAATLDVVPAALRVVYGSATPVGAVVFLRIRTRRPGEGSMPMPAM